MLIHLGASRTAGFDLRLALWLAGVAGAVNAAGFQALGFFSGNMTGNVSLITIQLAAGNGALVLWLAALVAAFVGGAASSAVLISHRLQRGKADGYARSIILEAALLIALAGLAPLLPDSHEAPMVLVGIAFVMGVQNAASSRISDGRVRTTHLTGVATDLGLEIAALAERGQDAVRRRMLAGRILLHAATMLAFLAGGLLGVVAQKSLGSACLGLAGLALMAGALPALRHAQRGVSAG